jgi:hypothetical protein
MGILTAAFDLLLLALSVLGKLRGVLNVPITTVLVGAASAVAAVEAAATSSTTSEIAAAIVIELVTIITLIVSCLES